MDDILKQVGRATAQVLLFWLERLLGIGNCLLVLLVGTIIVNVVSIVAYAPFWLFGFDEKLQKIFFAIAFLPSFHLAAVLLGMTGSAVQHSTIRGKELSERIEEQ